MTEQTYLVKFIDNDWNDYGFERFSYKRLSTVKNAINKLWSSSLYRVCTKGATQAVIYQTPYGTHEGKLVDLVTLEA